MLRKRIHVSGARILVMGLTFKENCPDIRNTKVVDIVQEFKTYGAKVDVYDPWGDHEKAKKEYALDLIAQPKAHSYDAIVLCVAHKEFRDMGVEQIRTLGKKESVLYDVKHLFHPSKTDGRL
jgi:UDP-N-acetyl-D-galactosamine dehydrogenase